ncbi:MAG TPA: SPFH domain-containing protein [Thermoanaerobaculia bacterium]|nr:SPFH domain-containing protein [Thermoanaerobaculia bacterium]
MENAPTRNPSPEQPGPGPDWRDSLAQLLNRIADSGFRPPRLSGKRLAAVLLVLLAVWAISRLLKGSVREIEPGFAGVAVNKLTGDLEVLPSGSAWRPRVLYDLHAVRVSDQLLSGPAGTFGVSTREGVTAQLTVQARWAIDRRRLLSQWAALPADPAHELVAPVLASAFRSVAPAYDIRQLISEKREELASTAARTARLRLAESGIVLKDVLIGDLTLPPEYERGRRAMVDEVQNAERMDVTLKLKAKEVEKTRLEADAQKARTEKDAEAAASRRLIEARAESEAMKFLLAQKEKEITQKKLEAEADKETRVQRAQADAQVARIQADAEAQRRRTLADAEAYSIRATSVAQFENLKREAELISANPLIVPKTFADRLSDKVQVILTPSIGGEAFTGEVFKRVINGEPPVATPSSVTASRSSATH